MSNELTIFNNPEFGEIRTLTEDDKILFCGKDVAAALGYNEPHKAIARHCKGGTKRPIGVQTGIKADGSSAMQQIEMLFIAEGDVYRLIAHSKLPTAEKFESWVFDEVLPSIRKHGAYMTSDTIDKMIASPEFGIQLLTALKEERDKSAKLENKVQIMQPKAEYFDELVDRNLLTNFRDTAKELHIKQNEFIAKLLELKYVYRDQKNKLQPYQQHVDDGLFELKECTGNNSKWCGTQTLITPRGRETFRLLFADKCEKVKLQNG